MFKPLICIGIVRISGFCLAITCFELLTYMASDMIMPAMPQVTHDLGASAGHIPFAFNLYLLGGVLLQWLIGPFSDCFGRRITLLMGAGAFSVACLAAVWVADIHVFNLIRLLQGMGLGFVIAVSYPALQEVFCEADAVRIMAVLGNIALLSPLLGPTAGQRAADLDVLARTVPVTRRFSRCCLAGAVCIHARNRRCTAPGWSTP